MLSKKSLHGNESIYIRFLHTNGLPALVAHDCGYPLSRYTCRATRVAADFLDFIAFCWCSTSVALHPLKILVSHLAPPPLSHLVLCVAEFSLSLSLFSNAALPFQRRESWRVSVLLNGIVALFLGFRVVLSSFFLGFEVVFRDSCRDRP